jgi:hypothetical protein
MNEGLTYLLDKRSARISEDRAYAADKAKDDRRYAFEREQFERGLLESRKEAYLKILAEKQETVAEQKAQLGLAVGLGVDPEVATALQSSGQLGLLLDQYDKNKKLDPSYIEGLNLVVKKRLQDGDMDEEAASKAMIAGFSTERDTSDPQEAVLAAYDAVLSATTPEELDAASQKVYTPSRKDSVGPFKVDFGYASGAEESETKAMRGELASKLQTYFKDSFTEDPQTGAIVLSANADPDVQRMFNAAEERARNMAFGPTRTASPTDAAAEVAKSIETVVTGSKGTVGAKAIADNFDQVLLDPIAFSQSLTPVAKIPEDEPLAPLTPEEEFEQVGDAFGEQDFYSVVDQNTRKMK